MLAKKIKNIQKFINNSNKSKPYIKMTSKDFFHKQIIVFINKENTNNFIISISNYIANINRILNNIKLDIIID